MSLAIGLGSIARKDASILRRFFFQKLLEVNWMARLAYRAYGVPGLRDLVALALVLRPLLRVFSVQVDVPSGASVVSIYNSSNERRALANFCEISGWVYYRWSFLGLIHGLSWVLRSLWRRKAWQTIRVSFRMVKRGGFLVGGRQAEFLLLYAFYIDRFAQLSGKSFASSTESNPEVIAAILAARRLGNQTTYVDHGFLDQELGLFFHDKLVLSSEALLERIESNLIPLLKPSVSWVRTQRESRELRVPNFTEIDQIGIVGSLAMSHQNYLRVISECLTEFPSAQISVKPHPNLVFTGSFYLKFPAQDRVRILPAGENLLKAAESWDFAIAGGSCAHLELIRSGVPTVYMDIDGYARDTKGFISSGVLPEARSAAEIAKTISQTYGSAGWRDRFMRFSGAPRGL